MSQDQVSLRGADQARLDALACPVEKPPFELSVYNLHGYMLGHRLDICSHFTLQVPASLISETSWRGVSAALAFCRVLSAFRFPPAWRAPPSGGGGRFRFLAVFRLLEEKKEEKVN